MLFVYFICAPKPDSYDLWTDLFCIVLLVRQSHNDMVFKLILFAYFHIFAKVKIIWLLKWYFFYIFMGTLKWKSYCLEVTLFVRFCSCAKVKIKLFWRIFFIHFNRYAKARIIWSLKWYFLYFLLRCQRQNLLVCELIFLCILYTRAKLKIITSGLIFLYNFKGVLNRKSCSLETIFCIYFYSCVKVPIIWSLYCFFCKFS